MNSAQEASVNDEVKQIEMKRPHVVILGAGASKAAFPTGDHQGKRIPIMDDLVETVGLEDLLKGANLNYKGQNFEDIYSDLAVDKKNKKICESIENKLYEYFSSLESPYEPSIYDHLILSLRETDLIATFNWDPFLMEAYRRNKSRFKLPCIAFLHGNVSVGYCKKDRISGLSGNKCSACGNTFTQSPLLYPIKEKNYNSDLFIANEWRRLSLYLEDAFMITIFGYGAPKTDVEAIKIMKKAWGEAEQREMEQIEIITKPGSNQNATSRRWASFTHSHHYEIKEDFYDSWIANHPRRTGEAYLNQYIHARFIENNPLPKDFSYMELWNWLLPLKKAEEV